MGPCTCDFNNHDLVSCTSSWEYFLPLCELCHCIGTNKRKSTVAILHLKPQSEVTFTNKLLKKRRRQERLSLNKTQKSQYQEKTFGKFTNMNSQNLCSSRQTKKKVQQGTNEDLYHINPTMWVMVTTWDPEQRPVNGFAKNCSWSCFTNSGKSGFPFFLLLATSLTSSCILVHAVGSSSYKHTDTCPKPRSQSLARPQPLPQPYPLTHGWGLTGVPATLLSVLPFVGSPSRTTLRCPLLPPPCRASPVSGLPRGLRR